MSALKTSHPALHETVNSHGKVLRKKFQVYRKRQKAKEAEQEQDQNHDIEMSPSPQSRPVADPADPADPTAQKEEQKIITTVNDLASILTTRETLQKIGLVIDEGNSNSLDKTTQAKLVELITGLNKTIKDLVQEN